MIAPTTKEREERRNLFLARYKLVILAVPLALYFSTQSFSIFLSALSRNDSVEAQLFVYMISAIMFIAEIVLYVICCRFRGRIVQEFSAKWWPAWVACACGILGTILLCLCDRADFSSAAGLYFFFSIGAIALAGYSVAVFLILGSKIAFLHLKDIGFLLAITGVIYAFLKLYQSVSALSGVILMVVSCFVTSLLLPLYPTERTEDESDRIKSEQTPNNEGLLPMFFIGVFLCIVSAVLPRLFTTPVFGAIEISELVFISSVCLVLFVLILVYLAIVPISRRIVSVGFIFCATLLVLSFLMAIVFVCMDMRSYGMGLIKANQTVLRIYLFIVALVMVKFGKIDIGSSLALYGIFVLAVPDLLINAVIKPVNFFYSVYDLDMLLIPATAVVAMLSVIASFSFIIVDWHRARNKVTVDSAEYEQLLCNAAARGKDLTPREFDVLLYLHKGFSVKKIAEVLCLSSSTIQSHTANLYKKLDVHSRQELIDYVNGAL